jgi:hypothetical protein
MRHDPILQLKVNLNSSCERQKTARRRTEEAGAPLSWTNERVDTLFVRERERKAAALKRQPQRAQRAMDTERAEAFFVCERRRRRRRIPSAMREQLKNRA